MSSLSVSEKIKKKASDLGFSLCGITGAVAPGKIEFHEWWVDQGFGADMFFLRAQRQKRKSLENILPGAKSVVVCAMRFPGGQEEKPIVPSGKIARYALHEDYHNTLLPKLKELASYIDEQCGCEGSLAYVDTGAISERALAAQAGLGWIGKNAMLIHPEEGSWFWLGEVITTASLEYETNLTADRCGKCRKCIDACPTNAIFEEIRALDSKKCLAYLNIEHRGEIPTEFHKPMGDWLLGCDICQEVCPWNEHSLKKARQEMGAPPVEYLPLDEILSLTKEEFDTKFKSRAVERAKHKGLQRNAKINLKNYKVKGRQ